MGEIARYIVAMMITLLVSWLVGSLIDCIDWLVAWSIVIVKTPKQTNSIKGSNLAVKQQFSLIVAILPVVALSNHGATISIYIQAIYTTFMSAEGTHNLKLIPTGRYAWNDWSS